MLDFEVQRCTRHCAATGRELEPDEEFFSVLLPDGADVVRRDFSLEAWSGPPAEALGCWKSRMPSAQPKKMNWAPNDVMLHYFEQLAEQPGKTELRYVLALLMLRRRLLRHETTETDEDGREVMLLTSTRTDSEYQVVVCTLDAERANLIQQELVQLLFADES